MRRIMVHQGVGNIFR
jgi:hypothetical protein